MKQSVWQVLASESERKEKRIEPRRRFGHAVARATLASSIKCRLPNSLARQPLTLSRCQQNRQRRGGRSEVV